MMSLGEGRSFPTPATLQPAPDGNVEGTSLRTLKLKLDEDVGALLLLSLPTFALADPNVAVSASPLPCGEIRERPGIACGGLCMRGHPPKGGEIRLCPGGGAGGVWTGGRCTIIAFGVVMRMATGLRTPKEDEEEEDESVRGRCCCCCPGDA